MPYVFYRLVTLVKVQGKPKEMIKYLLVIVISCIELFGEACWLSEVTAFNPTPTPSSLPPVASHAKCS